MCSIVVASDGVTVRAMPGETVLEALSRSGYGYRTGCTRGGCGICKVDLVDGAVEYTATVSDTVLSAAERDSGTCLTCRAVPVGDVAIALRDEKLRCRNPFVAESRGTETESGHRTVPHRFGAATRS